MTKQLKIYIRNPSFSVKDGSMTSEDKYVLIGSVSLCLEECGKCNSKDEYLRAICNIKI